MGKHQIQSNLEGQQIFKSAFSGFESPEGLTQGFGKTVGNGIEGWAPNAIFVDTNASQGAGVFTNTGTKTAAVWTEIADAGVAGGFAMTGSQALTDAADITFGTGSDVKAQWDGTTFNVAPTTGMWADCPLSKYANGHVAVTEFFDDFHSFSLGDVDGVWTLDHTAGTAVLGSAQTSNTPGIGGFVALACGATNNDFANLKLTSTDTGAPFRFAASGKKCWYECRFMVDSVSDCTYYVGLCEESVTEAGADDTGVENLQDGIYWRSLTATPTEIDFAHNLNGTEAEVQGNSATLAADAIVTVGFYFDGTTLTPYINNTAKTTVLAAASNFPVDQGLTPFFFVKQGASAAATIFVDYVKVIQMR